MKYENSAEGLSISVSFESPVSLPANTKLAVARMTKDNPTLNYVNIQKKLLQDFTGYEFSFVTGESKVTTVTGKAIVSIQDTKAGVSGKAEYIHLYNASGTDTTVTTTELKADIVSPDKHLLVFSASGNLATTYAVTCVAEKLPTRTEYIYKEDGLKVTAILSDPAIIPDEAELTVTRITKDNKPATYEKYRKLLQEGSNANGNIDFLAYNISFILDGKEIEPTGGQVTVTIEDALKPTKKTEKLRVFHVTEKEAAKTELQEVPSKAVPDKNKNNVAFTAKSFSDYIVLSTTTSFTPPAGWTYKEIAATGDTFTNTSYYNSSQPLGISGNFHIVAFGTATLNAHTNGNVLANILKANVNFGTSGITNELSYVQNYSKVASTSAASTSHVLALGSSNILSLVDNNNSIAVNGTKIDSPKNIWMDLSTSALPFINMNSVYNQIKGISSTLASYANVNLTSNLKTTSGGGNNYDSSYLQLSSPDAVGVYNISAANLNNYTYFGIKGFQSGSNGTVIINVDCSGATTVNVPNSQIYINGSQISLSNALPPFTLGRVIWNFINCSGKTINTNLLAGTVVAPDATINVGQNLNGSIIGNNVNINAESHRDDFYGKLSCGVSAKKVWKDLNGNVMTGSALDGLSVKVQLYKGTAAVGTPITLNAANNWTYNWSDLATGYTYSIVETEVLKDGVDMKSKYTASYTTESGVLTVTNQYSVSYTLPKTGGTGTLPFETAGMLMILLAIAYTRRKRKTANRISQ